jgi:universal stress protein A
MITLKNILVATDFGPAADDALMHGRGLAHRFGASLHLLHAAENLFLRATPADPLALRAGLAQRLGDRLTSADRASLCARTALEVSDDPADAIVAYARENAIDLIVMGTHGRHGLERVLIGSVAERVVRTAPCPVLTVKQLECEFVVPDADIAFEEARPS